MADTFQYKVRDRSGTVTTGSLIADSEALVLARLREQGFTPLDVRRKKKSIGQIEFGGKKVKLKEVAIFSRQFATMVNSGLPILRAVAILAEQSS
ncbi:MAG: type II secretion system F family protein, partial [Actinomycetota bacterium]